MEKIELEVYKTALQIELDESDFVIVFSKDGDDYYKMIAFWDKENQQLQDILDTQSPAIYNGKMIGWSKIPFYTE